MQRPTVTHWYDLDLEEVLRFRKQFLSEGERNSYIASSMFDYGWIEKVNAHGKPVLIIIEGVLCYFDSEEVKAFFDELCSRFDKVTLLFDMLPHAAVGKEKYHDAVGKMERQAKFKWALLHTKDMETWNLKIHLAKEYYMSRYTEGRYPFIFRLLYKIPYFFHRFDIRIVVLKIAER